MQSEHSLGKPRELSEKMATRHYGAKELHSWQLQTLLSMYFSPFIPYHLVENKPT